MVSAAPRLERTPGSFALVERARRLKFVLTDCDGVLTDGGVYYSSEGEALKRFSIRDGMGVERLRRAGISTAIVTGEDSPAVRHRAAKLGLPFVFAGVKDKLAHLDTICLETGAGGHEIAFIGDDLNDVSILAAVGERGLTAAPSDAMPDVLAEVHHRCAAAGGHGAFREFAEWILKLRDGT
jgi:3-deoxy-D-manno-octulosonate 8-phosphate phosphatase (KDO 8-P phosphatase)